MKQYNTKPMLIKRFISDGFDLMSLFLLFVLTMFIIMNTSLADTYNRHRENYLKIEMEVIAQNQDTTVVSEALKNNKEYQDETFSANLYSFILKALALFISETILYLLVPMLNKNYLTLGKIFTELMLFNESRQTKASRLQVVLRYVFMYLVSISLYPWTGIYTFVLIAVIRLIVIMLNEKDKTLCDYVSQTMLIDKESYSSII